MEEYSSAALHGAAGTPPIMTRRPTTRFSTARSPMKDKIAQARQVLADECGAPPTQKFRDAHADENIYVFGLYNDDDGVALDASATPRSFCRSGWRRTPRTRTRCAGYTAEWAHESRFRVAGYSFDTRRGAPEDDAHEKSRGAVFAVMVLALADLERRDSSASGAATGKSSR